MTRFKEHFIEGESDCTVVCDVQGAIQTARLRLLEDRRVLSQFVRIHPEWEKSLIPVSTHNPPKIIQLMEEAAEACQVGPMAAVAGALADRMQEAMQIKHSPKIRVIENGGEIILESQEDIIISLLVLTTTLKGNVGFKFPGNAPKLGIGTSSGQFGHAFSLGEGDAVTVFAQNAAIADAAATYVCNQVVGDDHENAVLRALDSSGDLDVIQGVFIARGGFVGQVGVVPEIVKIKDGDLLLSTEKYYLE